MFLTESAQGGKVCHEVDQQLAGVVEHFTALSELFAGASGLGDHQRQAVSAIREVLAAIRSITEQNATATLAAATSEQLAALRIQDPHPHDP